MVCSLTRKRGKMSDCIHGVFLGLGCKKCPKMKMKGFSPERRQILKAAMLIGKKSAAEANPAEKERMAKDSLALTMVSHRY